VPDKITAYSTTKPLAPAKGSAASGVVADKQPSDAAATTAAAAQTGDTLTLTDSARSLQKIEDAVAKAPVVDTAKVASVKQAIQSGTYQVNAGQVADKLLQFERGLK